MFLTFRNELFGGQIAQSPVRSVFIVIHSPCFDNPFGVSQAIYDRLKPFAPMVEPLTYDNVSEFADHARIDTKRGSTRYFSDPFASWQHGTIENTNRLFRKYIPKKCLLSTVTSQEPQMIEDKLNFRQTKRLG